MATPQPISIVRDGLERDFRESYVRALGGWSSITGSVIRVEAGVTWMEKVKAYAYAQRTRSETSAGVGAEIRF